VTVHITTRSVIAVKNYMKEKIRRQIKQNIHLVKIIIINFHPKLV
jgi:hypothetical protein